MKNVFFAFLACLLVFISIEALLRLADTVRSDVHAEKAGEPNGLGAWSIYSPEFGWERKPGFKGITDVDGVAREFDSQGYFGIDSKKVADETKKKTIFIGDATFGVGVSPSATYPEVVNEILPDIDAINLGVAGYSSYQGLMVLRKYLPLLKPAAVVATFNANDRREIYDGEPPDGSARFRMYRAEQNATGKSHSLLESLRIYGALQGALRRVGVGKKAPAQAFRIDRLRPRVDEDEYRKNLSDMAALARQSGIPLIFIVLRDNPLQAGFLRKGIESLQASHYDDAIEYLRRLATHPNSFNRLARIYLAKAYEAKGDKESASRFLFSSDRRESIQGGMPIRLDSTYNEIMRQVARENRIEIVEAAAALDEDPYVYVDELHFNAIGHRKVGQLVAARLSELLQETTHGPAGMAQSR